MATPSLPAEGSRSSAEQTTTTIDTLTDAGRRDSSAGADEKRRMETASLGPLDGDSPVHHYYLTFDTELPRIPGAQEGGYREDAVLPPCPNLKPYINPKKWSPARKNVLLALSCIATFFTAYTAGCYSPPAGLIAADLDTSRVVTLVGITTFCMGFSFAPMALAPISEIWGRFPVFIIAGIVFVVFQAVCSVMPHIGGLLVARFFVGCGASVFSSVVGGVIADLWDNTERNTPMALFSGFVLGGTGAGPLIAAVFVYELGPTTNAWKWTFWHQIILDGGLLIALVLFFKESRASVLLSRKAKKLNQWYEELEAAGVYGVRLSDPPPVPATSSVSSSDTALPPELGNMSSTPKRQDGRPQAPSLRRVRWIVKEDEQRASLGKMMAVSVRRPFHMLLTEPVVFCFSLWAAFSWAVLYLSFSVVPFLYNGDFNLSSRVYGAIMAAAVVATAVSILQQRLLKHPQWRVHGEQDFQYSDSKFWALMRRRFPAESPEARLYFACITALLLPAGVFGAFLCPSYMNDYAPAVGMGFAIWGIYSIYLATFNYLADSYHIYASSALAAQNFCRNVLGGIFPLIVNAMFSNMGLKGAGGMLGGIAVVLTTIPWVLMFYGERIRSKSKLAISLRQ